MTADKPRRLGRGLEALLGGASTTATVGAEPTPYQSLPLGRIRPNPYQPRQEFPETELAELTSSIRASGLLQPVTVRPVADGGFELIAGERRFRAVQRLGWSEIPAVVRDADDRTLLTLALIENLQRADLNPIDEAEGFRRLIDEFDLTQQQVADAVGKDRTTVANLLRVLSLPASVRRMVKEGQLSFGHARALLGLPNERAIGQLANEIVAHGLSVRDTERRVREGLPGSRKVSPRGEATDRRSAEVRRIEEELRRHLQTDVDVALAGKDKGSLRIAFYSADDLERLLDLMLGRTREAI